MSRWSFLGPWPLRPGWMFLLFVTVQNWGLGDPLLQASDQSLNTALSGTSIVPVVIVRSLTSLAMGAVVVAFEWVVWRLTTPRGRSQPVWAYVLMMVAGALGAVVFRTVMQHFQGLPQTTPAPFITFMHYIVLIVILHVSIGLIGSRVSKSAQRAEEALTQLNEQERRFVVSEERARRIAAEFLHDRVQADLLVIAIELRRVSADAPEDLSRRLASIAEVVESVRHDDVRGTSRALSPLVQSTGLASALGSLADRWSPALKVSLSIDDDIAPSSPDPHEADQALGIYRIVEQALLNAAAHGQARQAQVSISAQPRQGVAGVRVLITDDGVGFDPSVATSGGGFATSQVWARLLGGEWSAQSSPGRGTTVTAWVPRDGEA